MNRTPVSSSNVASIGYDPTTQTLEVGFKNGSVYQYSGVPATIYVGLMETDKVGASVGSYLNVNVKKAGYPYARLS